MWNRLACLILSFSALGVGFAQTDADRLDSEFRGELDGVRILPESSYQELWRPTPTSDARPIDWFELVLD